MRQYRDRGTTVTGFDDPQPHTVRLKPGVASSDPFPSGIMQR
jgi:hypothetical protein